MYALLFKTINWALNNVAVQGFSPALGTGSHTLSNSRRANYVHQVLSCSKHCWPVSIKLPAKCCQSLSSQDWSLKAVGLGHSPSLPVSRERDTSGMGLGGWTLQNCPSHRGPLLGLGASCQSKWPSAASLPDEEWTMENKVGAWGANRLNEPISQIIRLVDMLIFLP